MPETRPEIVDHAAEQWRQTFESTLLDDSLPFDVDWQMRARDMEEPARLMRLARCKAILPVNNALDEKTTHDATLENYIRLALDAAGDVNTLQTFVEHVQNVLETRPEDAKLLAQQVFWIWAPAAEVAGLYNHKSDMEEAAFKVLLPGEHARICESYDRAALESKDGPLERTSQRIRGLLDANIDPQSYTLKQRAKSTYSVWRKLKNEQRDNAELFDLLGFRVIIDGDDEAAVEQCYVAMAAIASGFESEQTKLKDYIAHPKPWGYQSLHLALYTPSGMPFELQVRTSGMHYRAEHDGKFSHQTYEATFKITPGKIKQVFRKIGRLYKWRDQATLLIQAQNGSTEEVMGDDILFFRPDANLYIMPSDGNALDASFRIHTRRALRTRALKRNGKPINLKDEVRHGDVIEPIYWPEYPTDQARFNNLRFIARTERAKRAIEAGKRHASHESNVQRGRLAIAALLGDLGLDDPLSVLDETDQRKLADRVGMPNFEKLLAAIGAGLEGLKKGRIANLIKERMGLGDLAGIKLKEVKTVSLADEEVLQNVDIPSVGGKPDCRVAGCCSEKIHLGDDVCVRASRYEAILKLHLADCVNVVRYPDTLACTWQGSEQS